MKDSEKPPLEVEIDWETGEVAAPKIDIGELSDPDLFDLMVPTDRDGLVLMFREGRKGLLFSGPALQKLIFLFDTLIHSMVDSASPGGLEENLLGAKKTKKVTLH